MCFGILAGLSITISMAGSPVQVGKYGKFYMSRLVPIHLVYLVACVICTLNRLVYCQPSDFKPYEWGGIEACRATKLNLSYEGTWLSSLVVMLLCVQAWPIGVYVWHISYYTWFSSAYQFCIFCFPYIHWLLSDLVNHGMGWIIFGNTMMQIIHYCTLVLMEWVYLTYRHTDPEFANYWIYGGYMFPPFWCIRFAVGCMLGYTFLKCRPDRDESSSFCWGVVTDLCTLAIILTYILLVYFGIEVEHRLSNESLLESRMYCGVIPRVFVPFFALWIYGLSVGRGYFAALCKNEFLVRYLSPASYSVYLLHQPVFEWYSLAVKGEMWSQNKPFEWFSPDPIVLDSWEAALVVFITVLFSLIVQHVTDVYLMGHWLSLVRYFTSDGEVSEDESAEEVVISAIEDIAGARVKPEDNINDTGLASLGTTSLVSILRSRDSRVKVTPAELISCITVQDIIDLVETSRKLNAGAKVAPATAGEIAALDDIESGSAGSDYKPKAKLTGAPSCSEGLKYLQDTPYGSGTSSRSSDSD